MGESADRRRPRLDARALVAWAMAFAWAAFVWSLGTDDFSNPNTSSFLGRLLDWVFGGISPDVRESLNWWIRTTAHGVEYGIWAALVLRALWLSQLGSAVRLAGCTLILVLALAAADEIRQRHSTARDGKVTDALLDLMGGAVAVACVLGSPPLRRRWLPPPAVKPGA